MSLSTLLLLPLLFVSSAVAQAQTQSAQCTDPSTQWMFNSRGQSPCAMAQYLAGVCNKGVFNIPPLGPTDVYVGPTLQSANSCRCSSVYYSMLSACSVCQGRPSTKWSLYSTNCTTAEPIGVFREGIPSGTSIPAWAYIDVSVGDDFDPVKAQQFLSVPESTATPKPTASFTTGGVKPTGATDNDGDDDDKKAKSNSGAIAGGVIGSIVGVTAIAGLIFFLYRRRKLQRERTDQLHAPVTPLVQPNTTGVSFGPVSYGSPSPPISDPYGANQPRLYNPSDPTTYPGFIPPTSPVSYYSTSDSHQGLLGQSFTGNTNTQSTGPASTTNRYTGAAEV